MGRLLLKAIEPTVVSAKPPPFPQTRGLARKQPAGLVILPFVIAFHAALIWALVTVTGHRLTDLLPKTVEATLIREEKPVLPPPAPPPPRASAPKQAVVKKAFVPPPVVEAQTAAATNNAITQVTTERQAQTVGQAKEIQREPVRVRPVIDAGRSCRLPQYPAASRRNNETGTVVLRFLIDTEGQAVESEIEKSSGYPNLDEAARDALALCRFRPGTVDGVSERSWARLQYVWKIN